MAGRKSSSKRKLAPSAQRDDTTGAKKAELLSFDEALPISNAVQAFHTIYRLATMCIHETATETDSDGDTLMIAMRELAEKHGRALDECLGGLNPMSSFGLFDPKAGQLAEASHG